MVFWKLDLGLFAVIQFSLLHIDDNPPLYSCPLCHRGKQHTIKWIVNRAGSVVTTFIKSDNQWSQTIKSYKGVFLHILRSKEPINAETAQVNQGVWTGEQQSPSLFYITTCFPGATSIEQYCLRRDTWRQVATMSGRRLQFGVAVLDGRLYVVGGRDGLKTLNTVECYNPHSKTWSVMPPMSTHRHGLGEHLGYNIHVIYIQIETGLARPATNVFD